MAVELISKEQLKKIVPYISANALETFTPHLNALLPKYHINTPQRVAAFIAQVAHESGSFKYVREIASGKAYEGRKDLGNIYEGDGVKFKGRGLIQITGRSNYYACSIALFGDDRLLKNPDLLATPTYAVESACWYWSSRNLNDIADKPEDWKTFATIRKVRKEYTKFQWLTIKINGGLNGYEDRLQLYNRALTVLK